MLTFHLYNAQQQHIHTREKEKTNWKNFSILNTWLYIQLFVLFFLHHFPKIQQKSKTLVHRFYFSFIFLCMLFWDIKLAAGSCNISYMKVCNFDICCEIIFLRNNVDAKNSKFNWISTELVEYFSKLLFV